MRIFFIADQSGYALDEDTIACGVAGGGHHLSFQRDAEDSDEDWGIHLEFDDQSHGGYECVRECRISSGLLSVDLIGRLGKLNDVTGFDVTLQLDSQQLSALREGLRRIFRDQLHSLIETT